MFYQETDDTVCFVIDEADLSVTVSGLPADVATFVSPGIVPETEHRMSAAGVPGQVLPFLVLGLEAALNIACTGGAHPDEHGDPVLAADPEWLDMALAYLGFKDRLQVPRP